MRHITEEQLIDYALGNLSKEQRLVVANHLSVCIYCRQELQSWNQILTVNEELKPSSLLHEHVMDSIVKESKGVKRKTTRKKYYWAASFAAIIMLVLGLNQFQLQEPIVQTTVNEYITTSKDLIPEQPFMDNPATNRLNVVPVTMDRNIKGDVWLNEVTNELILQVDGLQPLQSQDYQIWLVHDNQGWKDDLLQLEDGRVQVYYKGPDIRTIRFIKVSIEPIGGSELPTGPETLFIDLHQ